MITITHKFFILGSSPHITFYTNPDFTSLLTSHLHPENQPQQTPGCSYNMSHFQSSMPSPSLFLLSGMPFLPLSETGQLILDSAQCHHPYEVLPDHLKSDMVSSLGFQSVFYPSPLQILSPCIVIIYILVSPWRTGSTLSFVFFFFFKFWLHWVFTAVHRLRIVENGLSLVVAHGPSCPRTCTILVPRSGIEPTSPALEMDS